MFCKKIIVLLLISFFINGCDLFEEKLSSDKEITSFNFLTSDNPELEWDLYGAINKDVIYFFIPYNVDVNVGKLIANFQFKGDKVLIGTISQESGVSINDFSDIVTYVVHAEDGSSKKYKIQIEVEKTPANKEIDEFNFLHEDNPSLLEDIKGEINDNKILITVPYLTDVSSLIANFEYSGKSIYIGDSAQTSSETKNNFAHEVIYRVIAQDNSFSDYTIELSFARITKSELIILINNGDDVSKLNVSSITDMSDLFVNNTKFNQDISSWDVSSVTNMKNMFYGATSFNKTLSEWDVSSVTNMEGMFCAAESFNGYISNWKVSSVTNMKNMFYGATSFNKTLSEWDVSSVTNMEGMFIDATSFNSNLSDWKVGSVTNMRHMFINAKYFNFNLSDWDVSSVTNMEGMFVGAESFNQDLSSWSDHIPESIEHDLFSLDCPLFPEYHPYISWHESTPD